MEEIKRHIIKILSFKPPESEIVPSFPTSKDKPASKILPQNSIIIPPALHASKPHLRGPANHSTLASHLQHCKTIGITLHHSSNSDYLYHLRQMISLPPSFHLNFSPSPPDFLGDLLVFFFLAHLQVLRKLLRPSQRIEILRFP